MAKRILIFSLAYHPFLGGAELAVKEITDRIPSSDIEFEMITLRFDSTLPKRERIGNILVHRIGFSKRNPTPEDLLRFPMYLNKVLYPLMAFLKAVLLDRRNKFDALWSIMTYMGFSAVFFKLLYRKIPYILTLQDGDTLAHIKKRKRIRLVYPFLTQVFKQADMVQTISKFLEQFARDMGYKGRSEIIPNGVDVAIFGAKVPRDEKKALEEGLNIGKKDKVIVTASRLVTKNAVDDVIHAVAMMPLTTKLLILGDGPLRGELRSLAHALRVEDRVRFLGYVEQKDIPKYFSLADVFVRPSLSEGMGSAFVEAMAAGLPVIATPVGGIPDFLFDRITGLFCEPNNPRSIAEKVELFLEAKLLREMIVASAKKMAEERYDWKVIVADMKKRVFYPVFPIHKDVV
ncbi:MAG TPA: glycosyltransferase family 4 protein [Candidatus Paceibacterota bacterium]